MPQFADATEYLRGIKMAGNNSNLANILQAVGVKCSPCMQSALKAAGTREKRTPYYNSLRVTEDQIKQIEEALKTQ
jgi:hypothetical protein